MIFKKLKFISNSPCYFPVFIFIFVGGYMLSAMRCINYLAWSAPKNPSSPNQLQTDIQSAHSNGFLMIFPKYLLFPLFAVSAPHLRMIYCQHTVVAELEQTSPIPQFINSTPSNLYCLVSFYNKAPRV